MERLLTIGEFAQRCGLSRSALRFYDQTNLLRPRSVDGETGYRYYAASQLETAALVRRLRAAEMPVGVVRCYLAADTSTRRELLDTHLVAVQERALSVEAVVDGLRSDLDEPDAGEIPRSCALPATDLADALRQVSFAIADPLVRADLGAVWVETDQGSLRLVATDSYRMAVRDLVPESIGSGRLRGVIDAVHVTALSNDPDTDATVWLCQCEDGEIQAAAGAVRTTVGHAGEGFPDCERILSGLAAGHQIAVPRDSVTQALAVLDEDAPQLRLGFESDRLLLCAGQTQQITGEWSGPPLEILIDAAFFADAVNATVGPDLVIEASGPLLPIVLRSADTGTFSVLTMPIRPPGTE